MTGTILIVAGEKSGETYGAEVVRRFLERYPGWRFFGIGGAKMAAAGVDILFPVDDLAVIGVFEILTELPRIGRIFRSIQVEAKLRKPAAAVLIDSPDFNLRLAGRLKKMGVPVLYYIGPTVWAWRSGRLRTVKRRVRKMCLIFPFEEPLYERARVPARFVGHPLLERVKPAFGRAEFFAKYGFDPGKKLVTLMPGSRRSEIRFHLPVLVEALPEIEKETPVQFALVRAEDLEPEYVRGFVPAGAPPLTVLSGDAYEAMAASDLVLAACGTANLETALLETPLVAFYRISRLTYMTGSRFVRIKEFSIVNILAGKRIVPELIQADFTAGNLASEARRILGSETVREEMRDGFRRIKARLGSEPASENVAAELAKIVFERRDSD